jgi:HD-like signal output (HDOD) protein
MSKMMPDILSYPSKWLRRSHLLRAIFNDKSLPALPDVIQKLERLLQEPSSGSGDIAVLLESEPVVAGRVLKLANSAYYGGGRKDVHSVDRAISRLGIETVRGLVFAASLPDLLHSKGFTFSHHDFWKHSLTVAFLARDLLLQRDKNAVEHADMAYMAGLLHDLGILLIAKTLPEAYGNLATNGSGTGRDLHYIEDELLGVDHAEVGAMFIERHWKVDQTIVQAVQRHHHRPEQQKVGHPFALELYTANAVCSLYGIGNGTLKSIHNENLSLLATIAELGYDMEKLERHLELATAGVESIEDMLKN